MIDNVIEQAKADARTPLGLYVHVPFCASTCDFCAFYQVKPTAEAIDLYLEGIAAEAESVTWERPVTTIFWGGGTPGLLSPKALERLARLVRDRAGDALAEWSVELAPASVTAERLSVLKDAGVTRLSLGVQSFQPSWLEALGRLHSRDQVYRAYERIRSGGWTNVNVDLMFALPGQTEEEWTTDVAEAVALAPEHLSTYCLTFEEDTALWAKLSQGRVKLDPEREANLYLATWRLLDAAGYGQYEVSNFAKPGHACVHNVNTWRMNEWVGLGPSAASQHAGVRGANVADLAEWSARLKRGERVTEDRVTLTPALLAEDALIFGLRMNEGVDLKPWRQKSPAAPWKDIDERLDRLAADQLVVRDGTRVQLTQRGRLLADSVASELMILSEASAAARS